MIASLIITDIGSKIYNCIFMLLLLSGIYSCELINNNNQKYLYALFIIY